MPSVTYSVWPFGWWCQAVRAPGANRTWAQPMADWSSGLRMPSIWTVPVNQSAGPAPVWPPLLVYFMVFLLLIGSPVGHGLGQPDRSVSGRSSCQLADLDERLDRPSLVHGGVALGDVVEVGGQVEDLAGVDLALEVGIDQLRLVGVSGRGHTACPDVAENGTLASMVASCGMPTRPTTAPALAMPKAVSVASLPPTHSMTASAPYPSVRSLSCGTA